MTTEPGHGRRGTLVDDTKREGAMYVRELRARNIKLLHDVKVSFLRNGLPRLWTVLVGENGLGKTTILQALALAASGRDRANQLADVFSFPDLRHSDQPATIEATFSFGLRGHAQRDYPGLPQRPEVPPIVRSTLTIPPGHNTFVGASDYGAPLDGRDPVAAARSLSLARWFVAGYGVDRRLPQPMFAPKLTDSVRQRLEPLFDKGPIVGTGFADLFPDQRRREYVRCLQTVLLQHNDMVPRVSALELRGRGGVSGSQALIESSRFDFAAGPQVIRVPAVWLSQGYQATIAWIADVVGQQFWDEGADLRAEDMEGLVLLDEIDLHLHPRWQRGLVSALKETFPRLQFVVTTHSPMVLPGLERDEVLRVTLDEAGDFCVLDQDEAPAGMTGSELYETFFGLEGRFPPHIEEGLRRYGFLSGNPYRTDEEDAEMQGLRQQLARANLLPGWEPAPREQRP